MSIATLGVLPKIPFKLTQSIHLLTLKPIKGKLGFILEIMKKKKILGYHKPEI
jgi:hypothetical protein